MSDIERFSGYPVPPGTFSLPPGYYGLPGGGHRGLTDELDAVVAEAAEFLRAAYDCDVQIRFNSDRRSGGAFLMPESRWGVAGIGAGLRKVYPEGSEYPYSDYRWMSPEWKALPESMYVSTVIRGRGEKDQEYIEHASLTEAEAYFTEKVTR